MATYGAKWEYTISMTVRAILAFAFIAPLAQVWACSCVGPGSPCNAAGQSTAVFTGTVLSITSPSERPPTKEIAGQILSNRSAHRSGVHLPLPARIVRVQVDQVLSGVAAGQTEIEILTGLGGGDCGSTFHIGKDFIVYAYAGSDGRLSTNMCSRTRPLEEAAEDLEYLRAKASAPAVSQIRVSTGYPGTPGKVGVRISAEGPGGRHSAITDNAGDALLENLPPGSYRIHADADGDLPDDPKVELGAKGCQDITLLRTRKLVGRVSTKSGLPLAGVTVEVRSTLGRCWREGRIGSGRPL